MSGRVLVLALLTICSLECSDAFPALGWIMDMANDAGTVVDNAKAIGIEMPGYMNLLSSKSSFLTNLLHYFFGDKIEKKFKEIVDQSETLMPRIVPIDDVMSDNADKMSFTKGTMVDANSFEVTPDTGVDIIWSWGWTGPTAVVSIYFKKLKIRGEIKRSFDYYVDDYNVDGPVEIRVIENNFVLYFRLHPGIFERCYLKLYNVECTDMDQLQWDVKDRSGADDLAAEFLMQDYFVRHENVVGDHIKMSVANMLYREIPKGSAAICNNHNKYLHLSKYQTYKKTKKENGAIVLFDGKPKEKKTD